MAHHLGLVEAIPGQDDNERQEHSIGRTDDRENHRRDFVVLVSEFSRHKASHADLQQHRRDHGRNH
jgi:hypothetical protein